MTGPLYYARSLPADLAVDDDAGTAEGILVPWDQETPIVERRGDGIVRYREVFRPGSCDRAVRGGPGRLTLTYGHSDAFGDRLGVATHIENRAEGLWARFRADASKREAVRDALTSSHQGLSVAFFSLIPKAFSERDGSLVERRSVALQHVAAVPEGAYADARLLVVRNIAADLTDADDVTDADVEHARQAAAAEVTLAEALALVQAGTRWDAWRKDDDAG